MSTKKLYTAIDGIDDDLIQSAMSISPKKVVPFRKYFSAVACLLLVVGIYSLFGNVSQGEIDLTDRIVVQEFNGAPESSEMPSIKQVINIQGKIAEVAKDGLSFKLSDGTWVYVTDETIIGATCTSEEEKDNLLFEPTFRVGNEVTGYSNNADSHQIIAYSLYTNWNFENPIK